MGAGSAGAHFLWELDAAGEGSPVRGLFAKRAHMAPDDLQQALARAHGLFVAGDLAGAESVLQHVLAEAPGEPNALHLLAGIKRRGGHTLEALACFDAALERAPHVAAIHANRANLLLELNRFAEAVGGYDAALSLQPNHPEIHLNRARALLALECAPEALDAFERAIALGADGPRVWAGQGMALAALSRHEEALARFEACVRAQPNDANAHYNRGRSLQALDRLEEALAAYDTAAAIAPADADLLHNRAVLLQWLRRKNESIDAFDRSLALRPGHAPTLYTKGLALLSFGDFELGWPLHEERHTPDALPTMRDHSLGEPAWDGARLDGVLRIWPEQGMGDEILFARLAPMAQRRTPHVMLQCAQRLVPLFARAFPTMDVRAIKAEAPPAAAQIAVGSLGARLALTGGNGAPYLRADPARTDALRARYRALAGGRPIIGVAWASKHPRLGEHKSAALADWGALLTRDYFFVNLQYGDTADEVAAASALFGCTIHSNSEIDQMQDVDAFAAQISALDHIVSVSNTTVHLAGALGVPCTVLVPPAQGLLWYWGVSGEITPWYASVRIQRRRAGETWDAQVAAAAARLTL